MTQRLTSVELVRRIHRTRQTLKTVQAGLSHDFERPEAWSHYSEAHWGLLLQKLGDTLSMLNALAGLHPEPEDGHV